MTECNFSFYKEMCLLLIKTKHTFKVIEMPSFEVAEWVWWVWSRDFLHNLVWPLEQCCTRNSCTTLLHNFQTVFWTFFKPHLLPSHRELLKKKKTTCYPKSLKQPWRQNLQHTLTTKVIKSSVGRHEFQQRPWRSPLWPCCCCYFAFWTVSCRHAVIIDKICSKLHLPAKVTAIFPSSRSWWHWYRWREECCSSLAPLHGLATDSRSPELWRVAGERGLCPHSSALSITCVRIGKKIIDMFNFLFQQYKA